MLAYVAACAITTDILQLVGLKSFRVAGVMLVGLLLYDVFWVFGSPSAVGDNVSGNPSDTRGLDRDRPVPAHGGAVVWQLLMCVDIDAAGDAYSCNIRPFHRPHQVWC